MPDRGMLEALQRVTDPSLAHLPEDELLDELLARITELLGVPRPRREGRGVREIARVEVETHGSVPVARNDVILPDASPLRRVVGITGLDQAVPTHATLEAALAGAA